MPTLNFYNLTPTEISGAVIAINILLTFAVVAVIVWVYRTTHRGLSYSQSFLVTLAMVATGGAVAMMIVQQNIVGAFALLGTFSMIRFRTILKDTKDVTFVFFSLIEGVAVGTNNYAIALIALVLVSGMLLLIHRLRLGKMLKEGYLLIVQASASFAAEPLRRLVEEYSTLHSTLHIKTHGDGSEYSFAMQFKEGKNPDAFVSSVRHLSDVRSVDLMTGKETVEY